MDKKHKELLALLENEQAPFDERYNASNLIAQEAWGGRIEISDIPRFYQALIKFWNSLSLMSIDRNDRTLFPIRKDLARICERVSRELPQGQKFFRYYPRIACVEGPNRFNRNKMITGSLRHNQFLSIYNFHWEYPIEGFGVKKDLISVISQDKGKVPLLDWCQENDIIVFCNRCGLEITYDVSRSCPQLGRKFEIH